jgi:predicted RNase H-like HicB family nuclease
MEHVAKNPPVDKQAALLSIMGQLINLGIEFDEETDGRAIAIIAALPGCLAYGATQDEAARHVKALALRVMAERIEHGELVW